MAFPTYLGNGNNSSPQSGTGSVMDIPTGLSSGDFIFTTMNVANASYAPTFSTPSGWTKINELAVNTFGGGTNWSVTAFFYKISDGTESGDDVYYTAEEYNSQYFGRTVAYTGVNSDAPIVEDLTTYIELTDVTSSVFGPDMTNDSGYDRLLLSNSYLGIWPSVNPTVFTQDYYSIPIFMLHLNLASGFNSGETFLMGAPREVMLINFVLRPTAEPGPVVGPDGVAKINGVSVADIAKYNKVDIGDVTKLFN